MISYYQALFSPLLTLLFLAFILAVLLHIWYAIKYKNSNYKNESGVSLFKYLFDKGALCEVLIFMVLEKDKNHHHTLVNDYLSIDKGTTEVDCIHISESGVFVIESKNYFGAIYGNSRGKIWATFINGKKFSFYNPIWQKKHT